MRIYQRKMLKAFSLIFILSLMSVNRLWAQANQPDIKITVTADKADWIYKLGEVPKFKITATQNGKPVSNVKVKYHLGLEKLEPSIKDSVILKKGEAIVEGYSLKEPGFLRMTVTGSVNGKAVKQLATAGFEPLTIKPTITLPNDFNDFWQKNISSLAKIPVDAQLELLKDRSTATVDVYQVSLQNIAGSRVYGILCVPKKEGKYPALLRVPGAGVKSQKGDIAMAEKGFITLQIGIHGIPVNMPEHIYTNLGKGALNGYQTYLLDDKDNFYYKRVYLGCIRALDYLVSHPLFDGVNLGVQGGSQGGALAIVTAGLDKRVKYVSGNYPALSDVTGYLHGRAGGWPHYFLGAGATKHNTTEKLNTLGYYDVVNFAKQLTIPGYFTWGFNDETCPPTSMYAVYNSITAPKELVIYKETGHTAVPEQRQKVEDWLYAHLKK